MAFDSYMAKARRGRARFRQPLRSVLAACGVAATPQRRSGQDEAFALPFLRASSVAMAISDTADGMIRDANDRWLELFGFSRADAIGKTVQELRLAAEGCALPADRDMTCLPEHETVMRRRDGSLLNVLLSGGSIIWREHRCFLMIVQDLTHEQLRERELQRQRQQVTYLTRVVLLGELCGALAHELNRPLAAILANAQAGRRRLGGDHCAPSALREILDDIVAAGKGAASIIQRLRLLFMQGDMQREPVDLNAVARDALALTRASLAELGVRLSVSFDAGAGKVCGDPVQLQQVLLNLIVNACDAMRDMAPGERRLAIDTVAGPGPQVRLTVADSGSGIAPEHLERVFDSFFTTKPNGMGFGLSVSQAIVVAHGGRIRALNEASGGTKFRVTLPAVRGDAS